jgi:type I restriction enzyme M protein
MAKRKNETLTDFNLLTYLKEKRNFSNTWTLKKVPNNKSIQECLDKSSKNKTDERGEPDLIYLNENKKLLILIENKDSIKDHQSKLLNNPKGFAVDGIIHYLSFFTEQKLKLTKETTQKYLKNWKIIGIAFSGDIYDKYNHLITSFIIQNDNIKNIELSEILDEDDYLSFFENIDLEEITKKISTSSVEINKSLRIIDSQKRPVLLSGLMICLYEKENLKNDFKQSYNNWSTSNIIRNIPTTIEDILINEGIEKTKIDVLVNELSFLKTDNDLNNSETLKNILIELENNVIPLFNRNSNYDIIGKFYEEFLRYAGVANVKKGIVLTPSHITKLFTELIEFKTNDVIIDTCCGTGAFLISAMNKLISEIEKSNLIDKKDRINSLKQNQLIGFENSSTMYSLAISNMLFRGDGKSRIFHIDTFSDNAKIVLKNLSDEGIKPSIGFINPPYGGKDNATDPTKKEIQFLESLLDNVTRYGIIIAPLSTYFKDEVIRNRILSKHTLKYVINMPTELFQPNAFTHTAIAVFETNSPHNNKEVVLYNLENDGFVLSKNRGRTDVYNKWNDIKKNLISKLNNPTEHLDNLSIIKKTILPNDEWIIQAHSKKDNTFLNEKLFVKSVKNYFIFTVKKNLNLLKEKIDDITFLEILIDNYSNDIITENKKKSDLILENFTWGEFSYQQIFGENISRGMRLIETDRLDGDVLYFSASDSNNGLTDSISNPLFIESNALIYTTFGSCFFVEGEFTASDEVSIFKHEKLNLFNGLFIATVITLNKYKYTFGRKAFNNKYSKDTIYLPIDKSNEIDWELMDKYIKTLPYSNLI